MSSSPEVGLTGSAESAARLVAQLTEYAVIALDPSGTIVSWNEGARRLKGYTAAEAIGRSFSMFYGDTDRLAGLPLTLLEEARITGSAAHSGRRVRRDGSEFWADVVITALHDDDGELTGYAKVTRDLTDKHELEVSLRRSEERFRSLVEQVVDYAIIGLDGSGTIVSWNAGAERLKQYTPEEALGRHFSMFYPPEDRESGLPLLLLQAARHDGHVEHTGWRVRRDGSRFWGDVVLTALHDDQGRVTGFAKVTRDLTARKRFEEARESFVHAFVHDFRGPVTAIAGLAELVQDAPSDQVDDLLARIVANAMRLVEMTKDLAEHTRLATQVPQHTADLPLLEVVDGIVRGLPDEGEIRRIRVTVDDAVVHADRSALERVLANVLTNALKYSPGHAAVEIAGRRTGSRVRLVVSDRGRGIDQRDLPHIFDEFERGRLADSDGGVGLGLASVRRLVEQMGGSVGIESTLGVGTVVTLDLPGTDESGTDESGRVPRSASS